MDLDTVRDFFAVDDQRIWLLVGLCLVTVLTLQSVDAAVEGVWPHQRRPMADPPRARGLRGGWNLTAALVLPGLLLGILNVVVMLWRDAPGSDLHRIGGILVAAGWAGFVLVTADRLPVRRLAANLGLAGPLALAILLVAGDLLLLIGFLDILPSLDTVRDALPLVG
ncbi:MAG: hypothetical protein H0U40_10890 [Chloroflexia bacterium]|nr:hypothetical protein [Chloroflexia bacterium]MDQ3513966.1 hypothetical protein [Chloroflexota bacterium]